MGLTVDFYNELVEVPPPVCGAFQSGDPLASDVGAKHGIKAVPPEADSLMADVYPAFKEQVFHVPQTELKSNIHQRNKADHLRGRVEAFEWTGRVGSRFAAHLAELAAIQPSCHVSLPKPSQPFRQKSRSVPYVMNAHESAAGQGIFSKEHLVILPTSSAC